MCFECEYLVKYSQSQVKILDWPADVLATSCLSCLAGRSAGNPAPGLEWRPLPPWPVAKPTMRIKQSERGLQQGEAGQVSWYCISPLKCGSHIPVYYFRPTFYTNRHTCRSSINALAGISSPMSFASSYKSGALSCSTQSIDLIAHSERLMRETTRLDLIGLSSPLSQVITNLFKVVTAFLLDQVGRQCILSRLFGAKLREEEYHPLAKLV